jgi:hypothetical protein
MKKGRFASPICSNQNNDFPFIDFQTYIPQGLNLSIESADVSDLKHKITCQLDIKRFNRQLGVLENPCSGTFERFAAPFPST